MKFHRCVHGWILVLSGLVVFPQVASGSVAMTSTSRTSDPVEELRARFDPALECLRAGRSRESGRMSDDDRSNLLAAQDRSAELLDMRAGGAVEILLIVAVVLLIIIVL